MNPPQIFNAQRIAARRERLGRQGLFAPPLHRHASAEIAERILALDRHFPTAVEIGCGAVSLRHSPAAARIGRLFACDCAPALARQSGRNGAFIASQESLPLAEGSVDLLVSLLYLHHVNDLPGVLAQSFRALRSDGIFLAALFGEGALEELRISLLEAELQCGRQPQPRIAPFASLQSLGNLLARAGFRHSIADVERITRRYAGLPDLVRDLRQMGENAPLAAAQTPLSREVLVRAGEVYAQRFAHERGGIAASFPIIHLTGRGAQTAPATPYKPRRESSSPMGVDTSATSPAAQSGGASAAAR